jgi:hypothetical protein
MKGYSMHTWNYVLIGVAVVIIIIAIVLKKKA